MSHHTLTDRMTTAEIRTRVIAAADQICAHSEVQRKRPGLARGANLVRMRRWIIADTSTADVLLVAEVAADGVAMYLGPAAALRAVVPRAVRLAWLAEQYGETDDDPTD